MIDYSLVFIAGLLASLHCIGMCGPIVLAYSLAGAADYPQAGRAGGMALHTAYNGGRIVSYALLGALCGLAGMMLGSLKGVGEYVAIVGGALMVAAGIGLLGVLPVPMASLPGRAALRKLHGALLKRPTVASKLSLGLLTPLLPCGILYAMLVKAATAGGAAGGAATMAVFGAGMAPSLMLVGGLSSLVSARVRRGADKLAAVTVMLMGVILLMRGLHVPYLGWLTGGAAAPHYH